MASPDFCHCGLIWGFCYGHKPYQMPTIAEMQEFLNGRGYPYPRLEVDNECGSKTIRLWEIYTIEKTDYERRIENEN